MIIYFSGTGNSRAVATMLAARTSDNVYPLMALPPAEAEWNGRRLVFVCPVYSWGIPQLMLTYIRSLSHRFIADARRHKVWVVLTCGDETGRAPEMIERTLSERGLPVSGIWDVRMPNNYVLLPGFDVDPVEVERKKLARFPARVEEIAGCILAGRECRDFTAGSWPGVKTRLVYPLFKRLGIIPSRWKASDACVGCGRCRDACPMRNVSLDSDRQPVWGKQCVSCLACYHVCPRHAVDYGKATRAKGQYFYPHTNSHDKP